MTEPSPPQTAAARHGEPDDATASQTVRAQLRLRELVLEGELTPGSRIPELTLVERLGVSRTPVRAALQRLAEEGLLTPLAGGGYAVREFSERDIHDAIELRGTLEGLAARLAAERGGVAGSTLALTEARACLDGIDEVLSAPQLSEAAFARYVELNGQFHALLAELSGSALVQRQLERATTLPFANPNAFVMVRATGEAARDNLVVAQHHHRAVLQAIERREGSRAEALMREHARLAHDNLSEALQNQQALQRVPGARLIRRAPR